MRVSQACGHWVRDKSRVQVPGALWAGRRLGQGRARGPRRPGGGRAGWAGRAPRAENALPGMPARGPAHSAQHQGPGCRAGEGSGRRGAGSAVLLSEAPSEAAVFPGRRKQARESLGQDARGQQESLLQRPLTPRLLRKLAEVGFINAEVRPPGPHGARPPTQPRGSGGRLRGSGRTGARACCRPVNVGTAGDGPCTRGPAVSTARTRTPRGQGPARSELAGAPGQPGGAGTLPELSAAAAGPSGGDVR